MSADILRIVEAVEAMARKIADEKGITIEKARVQVYNEHPELYQQYVNAAKAEQVLAEERDTENARKRGPRAGTKQMNASWMDAQVYFLQCVFQVEPAVEAQLREMIELDEGARRQALDEWSRDWNLTSAWCREKGLALVTAPLSLWPPPPVFIFQCEGWGPLYPLTAKDAKKRMRKAFADALKSHFREMEDHAKRQAWVAPGEMPNLAFFNWAARYQVNGESAETIRDAVRYDLTETFGEAVEVQLRHLTFHLRPSPKADQKRLSEELRTWRDKPEYREYRAYLLARQKGLLSRQAVEYGYQTVLHLIGLPKRPDIK